MISPQFSSSALSLPSSMTRSVSASAGISSMAVSQSGANFTRQQQQLYSKEKEGHLFKRSQPKGIPVPTWSRRYFYIKNNTFTHTITVKKSGRNVNAIAPVRNVLLCNVRPWGKEDRRFTFEIYTSDKK